MSSEILVVPFEKQLRLADAFAKSGLFGVKTIEQALALMALCEAENIHPAKAVQDYHIIQGRPSLKSDAMLARFQNAGGKVEWKDYTDTKVTGLFSHPQGGSVEITWDDERVKKAELGGNAMHKKYPRQMKRARVISEAIRTIYPGVTQGLYVPEEVDDFDPKTMQGVTPETASIFKNSALRNKFVETTKLSFQEATTIADLEARKLFVQDKLDAIKIGSEYDQLAFDILKVEYESSWRGLKLIKRADGGNFEPLEEEPFEEIPEHMKTVGAIA